MPPGAMWSVNLSLPVAGSFLSDGPRLNSDGSGKISTCSWRGPADGKHLPNFSSRRGSPLILIFRRMRARGRLFSCARKPSQVLASAVTRRSGLPSRPSLMSKVRFLICDGRLALLHAGEFEMEDGIETLGLVWLEYEWHEGEK